MSAQEIKTRESAVANWREGLSDERLTHLIKIAFRHTSSGLARRLKQHGVLYGQWTLLRILWRGDGVTQRQLSQLAGVTEPSTITALKGMEAKGYVVRQKLSGNRKNNRVFLTPKGLALRSAITGLAMEVNALANAGLSSEDIAITRRTLLTMIGNLNRDAARWAEDEDPKEEDAGQAAQGAQESP
jgi:DNA-binding MarR family transcriptional regulator